MIASSNEPAGHTGKNSGKDWNVVMMKETGTNSKKFIWRQRIGFGISDYACNLAYLMVNTYLLIFYTDVAGIPAASAAFMFLI